jgi:hypothetical protein
VAFVFGRLAERKYSAVNLSAQGLSYNSCKDPAPPANWPFFAALALCTKSQFTWI